MGSFDLSKYATVEQRITEFYDQYPAGSIRTFLAWHSEDLAAVLFEARLYRTPEEAAMGVYTSGFAYGQKGRTPVEKNNWTETAETSAVGRALANLDFSGSVDGTKAPRPSREEMHRATAGETAPEDRVLPFGQNKGRRLGDLDNAALASLIGWCREHQKFEEIALDAEATLNARKGGA